MMEAGESAAPANILEDDNEEEIESGELWGWGNGFMGKCSSCKHEDLSLNIQNPHGSHMLTMTSVVPLEMGSTDRRLSTTLWAS